MYDTTNFRKGLKIEMDGNLWQIVEFQHVKPGKGGAFVRTRIKNMLTAQVIDRTFRSGDKVGAPDCEEVDATFLYYDGDFHFMNTESYDSFAIPEDVIGTDRNFLVEQTQVQVLMYNQRPVAIELPNFIVADITECLPAVAGNTATGATKPVTVVTGYELQVPLYIKEDDRLKIDTRDGSFVERFKD
ncbi:MAG TPA: elongation factor P [Myxococcales bacterium]|nr:elongation factor P [Myxococcales bacterium]HAN30259.1 elongation factor P [Myxococcales bacterium]